MKKKKIILLSSIGLLLIGSGTGLFFALNNNKASDDKTVVSYLSEEQLKSIANIDITNPNLTFLLKVDKVFSTQELQELYDKYKDTLYVDYLKDGEASKLYVELLFLAQTHNSFTYDFDSEIKPLLSKSIKELTLDEKLKIDTYFGFTNNGVSDIFNANLYQFETDVIGNLEKLSQGEINALINKKDSLFNDENLSLEEKELIMYLNAKEKYEKVGDAVFDTKLSDSDRQKLKDKITNNTATIDEMVNGMVDNYDNLINILSEAQAYKYPNNQYIPQDIEQELFKLTDKELKAEYEKIKNEDIQANTKDYYIVVEQLKYEVYYKSEDEVKKLYDDLSKKPIKDLTVSEEYELAYADDYLKSVKSNDLEHIDEHKKEYHLRYIGDKSELVTE